MMKKLLIVFLLTISSFVFIKSVMADGYNQYCTDKCRARADILQRCMDDITKAEHSSARAQIGAFTGEVAGKGYVFAKCLCRCGGFGFPFDQIDY